MNKLVRFDEISKDMYMTYIKVWEDSKEEIVPSITNRNNSSYEERLKRWHYEETDAVYDDGLVKASLYFLLVENEIVGAIHLRHKLNEYLSKVGGHIGYGVKPSERKKGYAHIMLKLLLDDLKIKKYEKVLITCDDDNAASSKTIEGNAGVLENVIHFEGKQVRRYWIHM